MTYSIFVILQGAKMAKYAKYQRLCDSLFAMFAFSWLVTRVGVFPLWIINNTLFMSGDHIATVPYYIVNSQLIVLLILHIFWTYLILKLAYASLLVGKVGYSVFFIYTQIRRSLHEK